MQRNGWEKGQYNGCSFPSNKAMRQSHVGRQTGGKIRQSFNRSSPLMMLDLCMYVSKQNGMLNDATLANIPIVEENFTNSAFN